MNRRSFVKKISTLILTAPLLTLLPFKKGKAKTVDSEYNWDQGLSGDWSGSGLAYKNVPIIVDDKTPSGYIDMVNSKNLQFRKTIRKEMTRSLYAT